MGFPMATRTKRDDEGRTGNAEDPRAEARLGAEEERDPRAALLVGLEELVPGLAVLDRELVLEGGARADLAASEPSGRLVFVQLAGEDTDRATLDALELLAALERESELLRRHLVPERAAGARAPRLLVVSPTSDPRLAARLAPLLAAGVEVVGLRSVRSAAGERAYLVRLDAGGRPLVRAGGVGAFRANLAARQEPLVRALLERMQRLDEELVVDGDADVLQWRLAGEVLARLEREGAGLVASVAPRHEAFPLGELADVERFVERALARLVRVLGVVRAEATAAEQARGPRSEEPILTPEEIQAFRE